MERGADALFTLADALVCESQAQSLPEGSWSPCFERRWPRISEALEDGRITDEHLRAIGVKARLEERAEGERIGMGIETSHLTRAHARTSADRTVMHLPTLPLVDTAIRLGWTVSTVVLLPEQASRWTPMLDQARVSSEQTAIGGAIAQRQRVRPLVGSRRVLLLADRWEGMPEFVRACHKLG